MTSIKLVKRLWLLAVLSLTIVKVDTWMGHHSNSKHHSYHCSSCDGTPAPGIGNGSCPKRTGYFDGKYYDAVKGKARHTCYKSQWLHFFAPPSWLFYYEGSTLGWRKNESRQQRVHVVGQLKCGGRDPMYGVEVVLRIDFPHQDDWTVDQETTGPEGTFALQWFVPEHRQLFFRAKNHGCGKENNEIRIDITKMKNDEFPKFNPLTEDLVVNLGEINPDVKTHEKKKIRTKDVEAGTAVVIPKTKFPAVDPATLNY